MWPWIKRWRDWAMHDLWPLYRMGPQPQALHFSYEKAGLTIHDQPIPWSAEAVLVEALVRLQANAPRRKADFTLRLPGQDPIQADNIRRQDSEEYQRITFRIPPPGATVASEVIYRNHILGQLTLPVLGRDEFIQGLRLQMPTLFVRLGEESVACQTFVATQCKGLLANAVVTSPSSLVPLLDMDLQVEFRCERTDSSYSVPVRLSSTQLAGRQALIAVVPRKFPRRMGTWMVTWLLGSRPLASTRVRAISLKHFMRSLRVSDTRFVVQSEKGAVTVSRQLPPLEKTARVGPCFLVCSRELGMAGLCKLHVRAQVPGAVQPPVLQEQEVLITDGPTPVAPGTADSADLRQVSAFELCAKGKVLHVLTLCPAPTAAFNTEGGFKTPPEFSWSAAAEEELNDRLNRLIEGRGN
jgi:hypothetical protein